MVSLLRIALIVIAFFETIQTAHSQPHQLVHYKIFPGQIQWIQKNADSSGFEVVRYVPNPIPPVMDVGIWEETFIPQPDDSEFNYSMLLYSSDFDHEATIFFDRTGVSSIGANTAGRTVMNFNTNTNFISMPPADMDISPPISSYPATTFGRHVYLQYDSSSEAITGILNISADIQSPSEPLAQPYNGFHEATYTLSGFGFDRRATICQDSLLITYIRLFGEQVVNETDTFSPIGGQIDLLRLESNLNSGMYTAHQIGSYTGSHQLLHFASASPSSSKSERVGIVRGNNTPISVLGSEVDMEPNDSLYHVYITRENSAGETEWLTELYAYNNTYPDTLTGNSGLSGLDARNFIYSIVYRESSLFVSSGFTAYSHMDDTLYYRNFKGQDHFFEHGKHSSVYDYWDEIKMSLSESRIYRLDNNGNVTGKLSVDYDINGYMLTVSYHWDRLFEVGDSLAWIRAYYSENDTSIAYTYTPAEGSEETIYTDLPAGKGVVLLWLNDDLEILGHSVMPLEGTGKMNIKGVLPFSGDTLLIYGSIAQGATVDLEMFDDESDTFVSADQWISFMAFYSGSGPVAAPVEEFVPEIKIHPNPAKDHISVRGRHPHRTAYTIHDLTGRLVQGGNLDANGDIRISELNAGMYVLSINLETGRVTRKFSVL